MFVVTFATESGDTGVAGVFSDFPTDGQLAAIAVRDFPEEVILDGKELYKLVSFEVSGPWEVSDLPEPIEPIEGP